MAWNIGWLVSCDKANNFPHISKSWLQSASSVCRVRWEEKKNLIAVEAWLWHQWTYKIPISMSMLILSPDQGHERKGHRVPSRSWSCPVVCLELKEVCMSFTKKILWLIVLYFSHLKFTVQPGLGKSRWSIWSLELEEGQGTSGM